MGETGDERIGAWRWRRAIALDGGTTNTRARLVEGGRIVATARREVGVRDTVLDDRASAGRLSAAVREALLEVSGSGGSSVEADVIVAAGMLTSEVGLVAVPHAPIPAGLRELADAMVVRTVPGVGPWPIAFVPGVRSPTAAGPDGWMGADLMRGEECETLGALSRLKRLGLEAGQTGAVFLWPGSHAKLVEVDDLGRITGCRTSLAGELLQAIAGHTLIAASLPPRFPESLDLDAAEAGARAVRDRGLAQAAFLVRIAALEGAMDQDQRASFWVGAVVAEDVRHLAGHASLSPSRPVWVGGRQPLRRLYTLWLGQAHDGPVNALDDGLADAASAIGALEVAACRGDQSGSGARDR